MKKLSVKTIVAVGIGTAIFFLLARFLAIPIFANTNLSLQYAVLGFFAVVFGPLAGLLIGLVGHILTDLAFGYGLWWSWIVVSAIVGGASGFLLKSGRVEEGVFDKAEILRFIIGSVIIHLVCWGIIAPALDIFIYAEPANKVFAQGWIAGVANSIATCVVGTLLLWTYSKTRSKDGSLDKQ